MAMLTGIQELNQAELMQMLRFYVRTGKNLLTFGAAGIGKTEMAFQACAAEGFDFKYINLSVLEAPDLNGLPVLGEGRDREGVAYQFSDYAPPKMLPRAATLGKKVVLIVDEADKAKEELQNPCLELFQYRSINGNKLDVHAILATGNLPDENAFSRTMSHALTNRCGVYRVGHSFEPWQKWAVENAVNSLVVAFLSQNTEQLLMKEVEGDDTAYCARTPRSWTNAAMDIDDAAHEDVDFQTMLVAGRVGMTGAAAFRVWLEHHRFVYPTIQALVEKGEMPNIDQMDLDRLLVCAVGSADAIMREWRNPSSKRDTEAKKKAVRDVAAKVGRFLKSIPSEIAVCAVKSSLDLKVIAANELIKERDFLDVYLKIKQVEKEG